MIELMSENGEGIFDDKLRFKSEEGNIHCFVPIDIVTESSIFIIRSTHTNEVIYTRFLYPHGGEMINIRFKVEEVMPIGKKAEEHWKSLRETLFI